MMWYRTAIKSEKRNIRLDQNILIGPKGEKLVFEDRHRNSFWLEIASTYPQGNTYEIDLTVTRDDNNPPITTIAIVVQHGQIGGLAFQKYWYFKNEDKAYGNYFEIVKRIVKVRDKIEKEKLNSAFTRTMLWHALYDIKGEIEKEKPYTINYIRQDHNYDDNEGILANNINYLRPTTKINPVSKEPMQ